ncbi:hypothetical protein [Streptodolium elevatio]
MTVVGAFGHGGGAPPSAGAHAGWRESTRSAVHEFLTAFPDGKRADAADAVAAEPVEVVAGMVSAGGKRLRPLLCALGWSAATP